MTLSRRSFFGALAGLPVLGHIMQRAPLQTDLPVVTNGYSVADINARYPMYVVDATITNTGTVRMWTTQHDATGSWTYTG